MSLIVAVHGIGQQYKGAKVLWNECYPPLHDGLSPAGVTVEHSSGVSTRKGVTDE
jgi:hypothetical protein